MLSLGLRQVEDERLEIGDGAELHFGNLVLYLCEIDPKPLKPVTCNLQPETLETQ
mgnify:CR=1 FL=1